jgi:hypothetical protein
MRLTQLLETRRAELTKMVNEWEELSATIET